MSGRFLSPGLIPRKDSSGGGVNSSFSNRRSLSTTNNIEPVVKSGFSSLRNRTPQPVKPNIGTSGLTQLPIAIPHHSNATSTELDATALPVTSVTTTNTGTLNQMSKEIRFRDSLHSQFNAQQQQQYNLWVHDEKFSKHELVLNPDFFPNVHPGDLLLVYHPENRQNQTNHPSNSQPTNSNNLNINPNNIGNGNGLGRTGDHPLSRQNSIDNIGSTTPGELPLRECRYGDRGYPHSGSKASRCLSCTKKSKKLVIMASSLDKETLAKQPLLQLSLSNQIASTFLLKPRTSVVVEKIDRTSVSATYVELAFRDQYLGRNDMWRLKMSLVNTCVYIGKKVQFAGCIRVQIKSISVNNREVSCGYITSDTRLVFRSESSRCYLFIQMSKEMWEFEEDGFLFNEKVMNGFLPELTDRWRQMGTNHIVSIILFTRIFYSEDEVDKLKLNFQKVDGRFYRDYYKVVMDWETRVDWNFILKELKRTEMVYFIRDILTHHRPMPTNNDILELKGAPTLSANNYNELLGTNSAAADGNILEALNMALNGFDRHYVDRDLIRTGLCVMIVTPASGLFRVDKNLLRMTFERMNDNGMSLDLVFLSKPPLHQVPLFQFKSNIPPSAVHEAGNKLERLSVGTDGSRSVQQQQQQQQLLDLRTTSETRLDPRDLLYMDDEDVVSDSTQSYEYFAFPHWVEYSYYHSEQIPPYPRNYTIQCKMPSLQTIGVHGESRFSFCIPYLKEDEVVDHAAYDANLFLCDDRKPLKLRPSNRPYTLRDLADTKSDSKLSPIIASNIINESTTGGGHRRSLDGRLHNNPNYEASTAPLSRSAPRALLDPLSNQPVVQSNSSVDNLLVPNTTINELAIIGSSVKPITIKFKQQDNKPLHISSPIDSIRSSPISNEHHHHSYHPHRFYSKPSPKPHHYQHHNSNNVGGQYEHLQILINPLQPTKGGWANRTYMGRWRHIYTKQSLSISNSSSNRGPINWLSLCAPACLPLTTDAFPAWDELAEHYQEYTYTISPNDEGSEFTGEKLLTSPHYSSSAIGLLKELISQRLAQGFQLVVFDGSDNYATNSSNPGFRPQKVVAGFQPNNANHLNNSSNIANTNTNTGNTNNPAIKDNSHLMIMMMDNEEMDSLVDFHQFTITQPYYLTMGNHIHRLMYDSSGQNVEVKRYVRRIQYATPLIDYPCSIWSKTSSQYDHHRIIKFSYPNPIAYNWNYLDHLISGYQEEMTEGLRFWRARFVLLPTESLPNHTIMGMLGININNSTLDDEEIRLALFSKFLEQFQKVNINFNQSKNQHRNNRMSINSQHEILSSINQLGITFSTLTPSGFMRAESKLTNCYQFKSTPNNSSGGSLQQRRGFNSASGTLTNSNSAIVGNNNTNNSNTSTNNEANKLTTQSKLSIIAQSILQNVRMLDRRWHTRQYTKVLVGNELVDFFVKGFEDISTREDGVKFGANLINVGMLVHCRNYHGFMDGHYFYCLTNEYISSSLQSYGSKANNLSWFRQSTTAAASSASISHENNNKMEIILSRSITIDLDLNKKSNRQEMAFLHYDTTYNPQNAYHFQVHWLGCTSRLVDDQLQTWSRTAEKCGLKLVEVPVAQTSIYSNENPFRTPIFIKYAEPPPIMSINVLTEMLMNYYPNQTINPSLVQAVPKDLLSCLLLKQFDFLLDIEGDYRFASNGSNHSVKPHHSYPKAKFSRTQFVHRSGMVLVQIMEDNSGLIWETNRLMSATYAPPAPSTSSNANPASSRNLPTTTSLPHPDQLRHQIMKLCSDTHQLTQLWEQGQSMLTTRAGWEELLVYLMDEVALYLPNNDSANENREDSSVLLEDEEVLESKILLSEQLRLPGPASPSSVSNHSLLDHLPTTPVPQLHSPLPTPTNNHSSTNHVEVDDFKL